MSPSPSLLNAAIKFREERGWSLVPSVGADKRPCIRWREFQRKCPTVEQIREWARVFEPTRWGVVTGQHSGIVVVDFDGEYGARWMREWGIDPHVRTGSGGHHWYGIHPGWHVPTLNAKTSKNTWRWPGVDIRGDGGLAILLGSNASGPYAHLRDLIPEPFEKLPADLVSFLRDQTNPQSQQIEITSRSRSSHAPQSRIDAQALIDRALGLAERDGRNNSGFWLACQLRDNGYSRLETVACMWDYGSRAGSTNTKGQAESYTEAEMLASIDEAYSRPAREPWTRRTPLPQGEGGLTTNREQSGLSGNADSVNLNDLYVDPRSEPPVVHSGDPHSRRKFSRIPDDVLKDPRLRAPDIRVYGVLAGAHWTGSADIGTRQISEQANYSRRLVIESLRRLETAGHIRKDQRKLGLRARYVLTSLIFHGKGAVPKRAGAMPEGMSAPSLPKRHAQPEVISMPRRIGQR